MERCRRVNEGGRKRNEDGINNQRMTEGEMKEGRSR
jgi:hypothetical protein